MIKRELIFPRRIMLAEGDIVGAENMKRVRARQIGLGHQEREEDLCIITGKAALIFDFGREVRGKLRLFVDNALTNGVRTCYVRIRLGESVGECCAEIDEKGACNDHSPRDFEVPLVMSSDTSWGQSGFRFARIDFPEGAYVRLAGVLAEGDILSLPLVTDYRPEEPRLAAIWDTAKRTIDLCAAGNYVWDGIKRDRLIWIGDMHPEMLALTTLYGRTEVMENSLAYLRDNTYEDYWMCEIPTYSAWWVIVLADYFARTGCRDFAAENLDYAERILAQFLTHVSEEGIIDELPMLFVDWPTHGQPDQMSGVRAILLIMCNKAKDLFAAFDCALPQADELRERLLRQPMPVTSAMQVAALKFFALGELPEEDVALLRRLGADGMSTFMSYYILTAYAHYFGKEEALEVCRTYYGGMLDRGATTFWEDFHTAWLEGSGRIDEFTPEGVKDLHGDYGAFCYIGYRHSLCHAWSSGVITFLEENK